MSFSSLTFIFIFLPISVVLYSIIANKISYKFKLAYLILFSSIFYAWVNIKSFIFIVAEALLVFFGVKLLKKKTKIIIPLIICVVFIYVFIKYYSFFQSSLNHLLGEVNILNEIVTPLGFSFITFELISYIVDSYKNKDSGSILEMMSFVLFFPKVVSGPIVLWKNYIVDIKNIKANFDNTIYGFERIIIGLGKKVIIADVLGTIVSSVWNNMYSVDSLSTVLASLCYMFQLYLDFSGYSDIAIGLSSIFGLKMDENFNYPYKSLSVGEFWTRWHISLNQWFKEYIYYPLGGSKKGCVYLNIMIVFIISGLWHGYGLSFLAWGIINGLMVCLERMLSDKFLYKVPKAIKWLFTFVFSYFSWILFVSPSISKAFDFVKIMFNNKNTVLYHFTYYLDARIICTLLIGIVISFVDIKKLFKNNTVSQVIKYSLLVIVFGISIIYIVNSSYSPFLYFQF